MADDIKAGDVVQLKSGGPKMTVTQVGQAAGSQTAWCAWFDGNSNKEATFSPVALKHAEQK